MKKYLLFGASALVIGAALSSCGNDIDNSAATIYQEKYNQKFTEAFGTVSADQDWGFGSSNFNTRAITVNGDTYDTFNFPTAEELAAAFPTAIPEGAKTDAELEALYVGQKVVTAYGEMTMYDMYAVYSHVVGKTEMNLKVTEPGEFSVGHTYNNPVSQTYNVYIAVGDGNNLTLKRNGAEHVNFYILSGNVTIDKSFGECGGILSVASGATVNDERAHIAHNDGIKVYNKGTYTSTNTTEFYWNGLENSYFDLGNNCSFYNVGKFEIQGGLSYSPANDKPSYLINFGDGAELIAPSMTLNSQCHFYNSGKVEIEGATWVTQKGISWINNGHYTTGSLDFSAWNNTFYNYCQLIVKNNLHMFDGEFNLMQDSYTEAGTAEMDNFIVNMRSNTGMYVKGDVRMIAQGDATYQGFRTNGSKDYLLIGGKVTVDAHYHTFSISNGITYSINDIAIVRGGSVVTEEYLESVGDGAYPVLDFNGTECPYGKLTVTPNTSSCGATWIIDGGIPAEYSIRIMAEDISAADASDFDFNDVVFDVVAEYPEGVTSVNKVKITLWAAGGTLPLRINSVDGEGGFEVHAALGVADVLTMIDTHAKPYAKEPYKWLDDAKKYEETITLPSGSINKETFNSDVNNYVRVEVLKDGEWVLLTANKGVPACKIGVPVGTPWALEKHNMNDAFTDFKDWVNEARPDTWYDSKVESQLYNEGMSTIYKAR